MTVPAEHTIPLGRIEVSLLSLQPAKPSQRREPIIMLSFKVILFAFTQGKLPSPVCRDEVPVCLGTDPIFSTDKVCDCGFRPRAVERWPLGEDPLILSCRWKRTR